MVAKMWRRRSIQCYLMFMIPSSSSRFVQPWIMKSFAGKHRQFVCFQHEHELYHGIAHQTVDDVSALLPMQQTTAESKLGATDSDTMFDIALNGICLSRRLLNRRNIFGCVSSVTAATILAFNSDSAMADSVETFDGGQLFRRIMSEFRYEIRIPSNMNGPNQKPLKTHFDEVNFKSTTSPGYEIGITVDPVRIDSLIDFGTPEEIAAKVVLAEVNRDGVFDVQLLEDPISGTVQLNDDDTTTTASTTYYQLNYLSNGKRGRKIYVAKFYIQNHMLLALTVQCKEASYNGSIRHDMMEAVQSFRVV